MSKLESQELSATGLPGEEILRYKRAMYFVLGVGNDESREVKRIMMYLGLPPQDRLSVHALYVIQNWRDISGDATGQETLMEDFIEAQIYRASLKTV